MIRNAVPEDFPAIYEIYRYWVDNSVWNLSWTPDSYGKFVSGIEENTDFPFLVSETEEGIIGYGTAHHYVMRDGYFSDAELTIYFRPGCHYGEPARMLDALCDILCSQNIRLLIGCITASNEASIRFHQKHGFAEYGRLHDAAFKDGMFVDVVWMAKKIREIEADRMPQSPFIPYSALENKESGF